MTDVVALKVSCVVPVFNGARYLAETLDSLLSQTHPPFDLIVVDDGSTDDTRSIARAFEPRIRYVHQENAGPAAARNRGVQLAEGALIAFQDADDLWHPEKLARQVARFAERPQLDLSLVHICNFWVDALAEEARRFAHHPLSRARPGYIASAIMARRQLFTRIGLLDPTRLHKDIADWLIRALRAGAVVETLPDVLVRRRIHETNLSRTRGDVDGEELLLLAKAMIDQRRSMRTPAE